MTNTNKARGSAFETDVVNVLRAYGHIHAARTLAGGREDRGDIQGVNDLVIQAKRHKEYNFGPWLDEARAQAVNGHTNNYMVVAKRRGVSDPAESFAVMPLRQMAKLLWEAEQYRRSQPK
jgi:hypothetical protein